MLQTSPCKTCNPSPPVFTFHKFLNHFTVSSHKRGPQIIHRGTNLVHKLMPKHLREIDLRSPIRRSLVCRTPGHIPIDRHIHTHTRSRRKALEIRVINHPNPIGRYFMLRLSLFFPAKAYARQAHANNLRTNIL